MSIDLSCTFRRLKICVLLIGVVVGVDRQLTPNNVQADQPGSMGHASHTMVAYSWRAESWNKHSGEPQARINDMFVFPKGDKAWIVGSDGLIALLNLGNHQHQVYHYRPLTKQRAGLSINVLWCEADGQHGWALGENGLIVRLSQRGGDYVWEERDHPEIPKDLYILNACFSANGKRGWAFSSSGAILGLKNEGSAHKWTIRRSAGELSRDSYWFPWLDEAGSTGWAVSLNGDILRLDSANGMPEWTNHGKITTEQIALVIGLWISPDGKSGWIATTGGELFRLISTRDSSTWVKSPISDKITSDWISSAHFVGDATQGWLLGLEGTAYHLKQSSAGIVDLKSYILPDLITNYDWTTKPRCVDIVCDAELGTVVVFTASGPEFYGSVVGLNLKWAANEVKQLKMPSNRWHLHITETGRTVTAIGSKGILYRGHVDIVP